MTRIIGFIQGTPVYETPWGAHETEIEAALLSPGKKKVLRDDKGCIQAAIALQVDPGHVHVDHLGSMVNGGGTRLMKLAIQEAKKSKSRLTLIPSEEGKGFYTKLGFKPNGQGSMWELKL